MAKRKEKDGIGRTVALGLCTLAYGMRFNLAEADDVQKTFAALVRAVEKVEQLEQRVAELETKAVPKATLKVAS